MPYKRGSRIGHRLARHPDQQDRLRVDSSRCALKSLVGLLLRDQTGWEHASAIDTSTCQTGVVTDRPFRFAYQIDRHSVAWVDLIGEFDADNHASLLNLLLGVVQDPAVDRVLVDMQATTFVDSHAIRALELSRAAADAAKKPLHLVNPTPSVRRIFEILELRDLFEHATPTPPVHGD
jgi:anti-anti-sigma factor